MTRKETILELQLKLLDAHRLTLSKRAELDAAIALRRSIEHSLSEKRFNCSCVGANWKLGIYTSGDQEQRGRVGLSFGLVSETLSALKNCPNCDGTGEVNNDESK